MHIFKLNITQICERPILPQNTNKQTNITTTIFTMNKNLSLLFFLTICLFQFTAFSQNSVKGTINDSNGNAIPNASVSITPSNSWTASNKKGNFTFSNIGKGSHTITISHVGFKTLSKSISSNKPTQELTIILEEDLLSLETVVVTGTFDPRKKIESTTSISTINTKELKNISNFGTASLLQNIPGTFTDASAGEVYTRVYNRGISAAAEDDMGWYYISLQEDGLPVSLVQHSYYSPDLFHRSDLMTQNLEAIRGGSSSITAMNGPGGIFNFISHGIRNEFGGELQLQGGALGNGNSMYRIDGVIGGPIGNDWFFNAGGHYRNDDGARNTDYTFSQGGQFKFNLIKKMTRGQFKFYGKLLDDKTNRWTGVAATNWNDPKAAFGQDFSSTSLLMPSFNGSIPDGRNIGTNNSFDPSQGVHAKDLAFGIDFSYELGNDWSLKNNLKYSSKSANWQTSISNAFVSISNPLAYFITGAQFPVGTIVFKDAQSGTELASVDNSAILVGGAATYNSGSLPNDAIMGTSAWYKDNSADEWMNQLTLRKKSDTHDFNGGFALGYSDTDHFTQGTFGFVTYEPNPRMLQVSIENQGQPVVPISDENGLSNYGGLFFVNARAEVKQLAAFLNDRWKLSENIHLDLGLRYETINHKGSKDRYAPFVQNGGVDGNQLTDYDNGVLAPTGVQDAFDYDYNYLSFSAGINFKIDDNSALFSRFSQGNKAPELNYYFNNFSNVPINQKGAIQKINQLELGYKYNQHNFSFTTTAFWSQLKNVGIANFEFDDSDNSIFYTPILFNTSNTLGMEWESIFRPIANISIIFNGVVQNPKASDWKIYDAASSVDESDDSVVDYSGNDLPFNPKIMFNLTTAYENDKISAFVKWQFMGKREGNIANAFQLPAYSTFNLGAAYKLSDNLTASLSMTNAFNSQGLANFFGANEFGASANGATQDYINDNPDASFVVFPILGRRTFLKLNYTF
jgi:outer membrane receptor protein involved in Fe transport